MFCHTHKFHPDVWFLHTFIGGLCAFFKHLLLCLLGTQHPPPYFFSFEWSQTMPNAFLNLFGWAGSTLGSLDENLTALWSVASPFDPWRDMPSGLLAPDVFLLLEGCPKMWSGLASLVQVLSDQGFKWSLGLVSRPWWAKLKWCLLAWCRAAGCVLCNTHFHKSATKLQIWHVFIISATSNHSHKHQQCPQQLFWRPGGGGRCIWNQCRLLPKEHVPKSFFCYPWR